MSLHAKKWVCGGVWVFAWCNRASILSDIVRAAVHSLPHKVWSSSGEGNLSCGPVRSTLSAPLLKGLLPSSLSSLFVSNTPTCVKASGLAKRVSVCRTPCAAMVCGETRPQLRQQAIGMWHGVRGGQWGFSLAVVRD